MAAIFAKLPYYAKIKQLFGSALIGYWPLWEPGGTIAYDQSSYGRHGAYGAAGAAPALGQAGIGDGHTCPNFDGGDYANVFTTSLRDAINLSEGTLITWLAVDDVARWTDGLNTYPAELTINAQNRVSILRSATNNTMTVAYRGQNVLKQVNIGGLTGLGWYCLGLTWSISNDRVRGYVNGIQSGANQTTLTVLSGTFAVALIGAQTLAPVGGWKGRLAHVMLCNREATPTEMLTASRPF